MNDEQRRRIAQEIRDLAPPVMQEDEFTVLDYVDVNGGSESAARRRLGVLTKQGILIRRKKVIDPRNNRESTVYRKA